VPLADEDGPADAGEVAVDAGVGPRLPLGVAAGLPLGVADGLAETGLGASRVQAAMTTRSLAGSALPPTPLRSTK
jgi:hypothetical protein